MTKLPKYASHLRAAFVRIPECNTLESLKKSPSVEDGDRQELIDQELNKYFAVDRFLAKGDIFSISVNWDCKSPLCVACNEKMKGGSNDTIYFKVNAFISLHSLIENLLFNLQFLSLSRKVRRHSDIIQ